MEQILEVWQGDELPTLRGQLLDSVTEAAVPTAGYTIQLRVLKTAGVLVKEHVNVEGVVGGFDFVWDHEARDLDEAGTLPALIKVIQDSTGKAVTIDKFWLLVKAGF